MLNFLDHYHIKSKTKNFRNNRNNWCYSWIRIEIGCLHKRDVMLVFTSAVFRVAEVFR